MGDSALSFFQRAVFSAEVPVFSPLQVCRKLPKVALPTTMALRSLALLAHLSFALVRNACPRARPCTSRVLDHTRLSLCAGG